MTDDEVTAYLDLLSRNGWKVVTWEGGVGDALAGWFRARYPRIPQEYEEFLARVRSCVSADETIWFLCADDYNQGSDVPFAWNEYEKLELESLDGESAEEEAEIRRFWDRHLPFIISVASDYAYLAFRVAGEPFGSVVDGYELELREVTDIAGNLDEFVRLHTRALNGEAGALPGNYV